MFRNVPEQMRRNVHCGTPCWIPTSKGTFEKHGGQTKMRLTWVPHEASAAEIACFAAAFGGMDKGWGAGMELLAKLLAELRA